MELVRNTAGNFSSKHCWQLWFETLLATLVRNTAGNFVSKHCWQFWFETLLATLVRNTAGNFGSKHCWQLWFETLLANLVRNTAGNFGFKCTHNFRNSTHFTVQIIAACFLFIINSILPLNAVYTQHFYGPPYSCRAANCPHLQAHESTCDEPMNDVEWHHPVFQVVQGYL
jgi:hypothetical protein